MLGTGAGIWASAEERRRQLALLKEQKREAAQQNAINQNIDPTKRASARYILNRNADAVKSANRIARNRAQMGFSPNDTAVAVADANAKSQADLAGQIAANYDNIKDAQQARYEQQRANLNAQINAASDNSTEIGKAIQGVTAAASSIAGGLESKPSIASQMKAAKPYVDAAVANSMSKLNQVGKV